jgi:hypothetical protein
MARPKKNGKSEQTAADKLLAEEQALDKFLNSTNGKKILAETEEIAKGLQNINPLAIGHRLTVIREYFGVSKKDRHTNNSKMFEIFKRTKVYRLGFTKPTVNRYIGAWEAAVKVAPEPFVMELASRLFGERVSDEKPFGRYTTYVLGTFLNQHKKEELADEGKIVGLVDKIMKTTVTTTTGGRGGRHTKKNYLLLAYDAVMELIHRKLIADESPTDSLEAKDRFYKDLVPVLLAGFGLHPKFEIGAPEILEALPKGYKTYADKFPQAKAAAAEETAKPKRDKAKGAAAASVGGTPADAAIAGVNQRVAAAATATTAVEENPTEVVPHDHQHNEDHQHNNEEEHKTQTPFAAS